MRSLAWALLVSASVAATSGRAPAGRVVEVSTADELIEAFLNPLQDVTVKLAPGTYELTPVESHDAPARACDDTGVVVPVTLGLMVSGKNVRLVGPADGEAVIVTHATQGIYFKDCQDCEIERLTVTGTPSDADAISAYGALVVARSSVHIAHCLIRDNVSRQGSDYAGTSGICARDDADLVIEFNEIIHNSLGIVLFGETHAVVRNNVVDQRDSTGGGGIRIGCDAVAVVERNYFRGGGAFGIQIAQRAGVVCKGNLVEEVSGVGMAAINVGAMHAVLEKNLVFRADTGMWIGGIANDTRGPGGRASGNIIVEAGAGGALVTRTLNADFVVRGNTFYKNAASGDAPEGNGTREMFWRARRQWTRTYRNTAVGVDGRHHFYESAFLTRYGRWLN